MYNGSIPISLTMGQVIAKFEALLLTGDDGSITPQILGINYTASSLKFNINTNKKLVKKIIS